MPFVSQLGEGADRYVNDCGAASVSMLIEYYTGAEFKPDGLMDIVGKDRYLRYDDLVNLLNSYGLETDWGFEFPRIVLICGNHWVVYVEDGLYHDPMRGPYREGWLGPGIYVKSVKNDELFRLEK